MTESKITKKDMNVIITNNHSSTDSTPVPLRVWLIWLCGALFYCYQFILRTSPSVISEDLMVSFGVEGFGLGILTAFYYNAYASMQIPVGILLDRFGIRYLLTGAVLICATGSCLFGLATDVPMASLGRLLIGVGSSFAYIGTLKMATLWFPENKMGRVIGMTMLFGTLGAWLGGFPFGYLSECLGWRDSMFIMVALGVGLSLTFFLIIRNKPEDLGLEPINDESPPTKSLFTGLKVVCQNPQAWIIAGYAGLMYVPLSAFADLWGTPFFAQLFQTDRTIAASITSMIYIGIAVGSPLITYLSDRYENRTLFMKTGAFICLVIYIIAIYIPHVPSSFMYVLLFIAGIAFTGQVLSFVLITQTLPRFATGVAVGLTNMLVMSSGVIFEPLVGKLLTFAGKPVYDHGSMYYAVEDFQIALSVVPLSLLAAFILAFSIKEPVRKKYRSLHG